MHAFSDTLNDLLGRVAGARAATLMGYDGVEIANVIAAEESLEGDAAALLVEFSAILQKLKGSTARLGTGELQELVLVTDQLALLVRPVGAEHFAALLAEPATNLGLARFALRATTAKLESAL
jgi:predicted regulator of Ras-like GTPase activity (Roadblock/LC7/MglB family)